MSTCQLENKAENKVKLDIELSSDQLNYLRTVKTETLPKESEFASILQSHSLEIGQIFLQDWTTLLNAVYKCYLENSSFDSSDFSFVCDSLINIVWEKLNVGHWKNVTLGWRKAYSCLILIKVLKSLSECVTLKDILKLLKYCDRGLLMGAPIFNNSLSTLAKNLHFVLPCYDNNLLFDESTHDFSPSKRMKLNDPFVAGANNLVELERYDRPSCETFNSLIQNGRPFILTHCINNWPAFSPHYKHRNWNVDYLRKIAGWRTVPIEIGSSYANDDWTQKLMTINDFIDRYYHTDCAMDKPKGYLAQHQLFDQICELNDDILIPDYCYMSSDEDDEEAETQVEANCWVGPACTVSPLHHDLKKNLLVQVYGSKYVRLYGIDQTKYLYAHEGSFLSNTSQINIELPDFEKFPLFSKATGFHGQLNAGEILFIPPKVWHFIKSLSVSFSVNFWWK